MRNLRLLLLPLMALPLTSGAQDGSADEFVVVGEYLKPEITVVIARENLNKAYDLQLDESFLERIIDSVEKAPF